MNKIATLLIVFTLPCFAQTAPNQGAVPGSPSPAKSGDSSIDAQFATKAAQGNMTEVALGKLAQEKAQRDEIKKFGQKMVDEHTKAEQDLEGIASKNNMTLPQDINAQQKAEQARLSKLSGAQFDRMYMRLMVADHTKDEAEFQRESRRTAANTDMKDYATRTYQVISDHLTMAKTISDSLGKANTKGGGSK